MERGRLGDRVVVFGVWCLGLSLTVVDNIVSDVGSDLVRCSRSIEDRAWSTKPVDLMAYLGKLIEYAKGPRTPLELEMV